MSNDSNQSASAKQLLAQLVESLPGFDPIEFSVLSDISALLSGTYLASLTSALTPERLVLLFLYAPTAIVAFFGNLTVLAAFWVERKQLLRVHFNLYIVILTCLDLFLASIDIPLYIVSVYHYYLWPKDEIGCAIQSFIDQHLEPLSVMTVVSISIDRFWAACFSTHYRNHNTRLRMILLLGLMW